MEYPSGNGADDTDSGHDDGLFGISEELVQSPTHKTASTGAVDFDGLLQPPLKLHEDLSEGCGGQLWPAGMVLAKYLLRMRHEDISKANSIVELGAGGGLVGLAIACGCQLQKAICITDQLPMLELMQQNIRLNDLQHKASAHVYDWGTPRPSEIPEHPDIILAADCVYFEPAFPLLLQTLQELIGTNSACYFCFKRRRRADMQFLKTARKVFDVQPIADDPDNHIYSRENIFVFAIRQKPTH